jgi:hypothetical protein
VRDLILLDKNTKESIFCNRKLVRDTKERVNELILSTSVGELYMKSAGIVPSYPKRVWYYPNAISRKGRIHKSIEECVKDSLGIKVQNYQNSCQ